MADPAALPGARDVLEDLENSINMDYAPPSYTLTDKTIEADGIQIASCSWNEESWEHIIQQCEATPDIAACKTIHMGTAPSGLRHVLVDISDLLFNTDVEGGTTLSLAWCVSNTTASALPFHFAFNSPRVNASLLYVMGGIAQYDEESGIAPCSSSFVDVVVDMGMEKHPTRLQMSTEQVLAYAHTSRCVGMSGSAIIDPGAHAIIMHTVTLPHDSIPDGDRKAYIDAIFAAAGAAGAPVGAPAAGGDSMEWGDTSSDCESDTAQRTAARAAATRAAAAKSNTAPGKRPRADGPSEGGTSGRGRRLRKSGSGLQN